MPDIRGQQVAQLGGYLTGSRGSPQVPPIPLAEAFVMAPTRGSDRCEPVRAPELSDRLEEPLRHLGSKALGVVVGPHVARRGVGEHEGRRPLGIGGGEQHRHRSAVEPGHDGRSFRSDGVQDDPHVVGPLLPRREMIERHRVRNTRPTSIEEDEAAERCQTVKEVLVQRLFPPKVDVRRHAGKKDQIDRALP